VKSEHSPQCEDFLGQRVVCLGAHPDKPDTFNVGIEGNLNVHFRHLDALSPVEEA
jgi:hypothetical protein